MSQAEAPIFKPPSNVTNQIQYFRAEKDENLAPKIAGKKKKIIYIPPSNQRGKTWPIKS
jgi:hypothetical protein